MGARFKRRKKPGRKIYSQFSSGAINTGKGPNVNVIAEYRDRTRFLRLDDRRIASIEKLFGANPRVVAARESANKVLREFKVIGKQSTIEQFGFGWTGARHHGLNLFVRESLIEGAVKELSLFFFMEQAFFVEYNKVGKWIRKSIIYKGRQNALIYYEHKKISWLNTTRVED